MERAAELERQIERCPKEGKVFMQKRGLRRLALLDEPGRVESPLPSPTAYELAAVALKHVGQLVCGVQGHDHMVQFDQGRMFLRCVSCGQESPGWDVPGTLKLPRPIVPKARVVSDLPARRAA